MKYLIIGDIHGRDLSDIEQVLNSEKIDVLICTGDFDQAKTIRQFIELEKRLKSEDKEVIIVPGNHDEAILNNHEIYSGTIQKQGKTFQQLHTELIKDKIAYEYIKKLVNSKHEGFTTHRVRIFLDQLKYGKSYQTLVIHGAYKGDLSSNPYCDENNRDLWTRLTSYNDYKENFEVMSKKKRMNNLTMIHDDSFEKVSGQNSDGYNIIIRGHDHTPLYVYNDKIKGIIANQPKFNEKYQLLKERKHAINPGAYFDGYYVIINTNSDGETCPILTYNKL